jgi:hypothetical protein
MKYLLGAAVVASSLGLAITAFAQSAAPAPAPAVQANPAPAVPVSPSKRYACRASVGGMQGQERIDQMQLCMAQAHLDCLKQAIDQKIVGPQRRNFVRTCVGEVSADQSTERGFRNAVGPKTD